MAQHDYDIANGTGAAVRTDINNVLDAVVSQNSGGSAPSTTFSYQQWADTSAGLLKIRNGANNAWVTVGTLDAANLGLATLASPNLSGNPTAPTPSSGDNDTSIATTAFVKALVDSAVATAVGNLTDSQMPAGSVVQVKTFRTEGAENTNSTSFVGSSLTGSITPQSSSNKILIVCNVTVQNSYNINGGPVNITAYRGSGLGANLSGTNLASFANSQLGASFGVYDPIGGVNPSGDRWGQLSINHLDSPSSTSSVNYTVAFRNQYTNRNASVGGNTSFPAESTMTLMEIKG